MTGAAVGLGSAARSTLLVVVVVVVVAAAAVVVVVVLVVVVKSNLVTSGYFGPEKYIIATPLLLPMDRK